MLGTIVVVVVGAVLAAVVVVWLYGERWRPLRLSTWRLARELGLRRILNLSALHAYIYGRWINEYLNLFINYVHPRLGQRGKKWAAEHYHAKVLTPDHAQSIITIDQEIPLRDLEQIIPYSMAREFVLQGPPDVAAFECGCRHARENPCEPFRVCMAVGQPFAGFILDHHPQTSRLLTQEEALELLRAEHDRGHVHTAWFKDACGGRFYAICNCCKCCCIGIEGMVKYGIPMVASSGYVAQVDQALCAGCGTCEELCPFEAVQVDETAVVKWEACMGCGVCVGQCPNEAVSLVRDEGKGIPLDVRALVQEQALL